MKKNKLETIENTEYINTDAGEPILVPISKLDIDFGRDDLNLLRDKINELIENK